MVALPTPIHKETWGIPAVTQRRPRSDAFPNLMLKATDIVLIHNAIHSKPLPATVPLPGGALLIEPNNYGNGSVLFDDGTVKVKCCVLRARGLCLAT